MPKPRPSSTKRNSKKEKNCKYVFVIGGVMSGVGKGIATASIGKILAARGFNVNLMKIDPYLNVDAGTMNPTEHGEVFVLDSGLETDQDMGNYERFLNRDLGEGDYMTSGMVYQSVINRERNLGYHGKFVEAIPHVRDEIAERIVKAARDSKSDISVIEIGGTIGDFQNALYIEAARVLKMRNPGSVLFIMVSYLPVPSTIGEMKTRPTQHAIRELNSYGVQADIVIARSTHPLDKKRKEKLAIWCNVDADNIVSAPDVDSIYDVPLNFERDRLSEVILNHFNIKTTKKPDLADWREFAKHAHNGKHRVKIGIVGKYFDTGDFTLSDAYLSVIEAIKFSAYKLGVKPEISWLSAKHYEENPRKLAELEKFDGIIVPGGFGETGIEGKIKAINFARTHKIPYFGLCYGMQLMVIEYARNVLGLKGANTAEIDPNAKYRLIDVMEDQKEKIAQKRLGGSMRLGAQKAILKKGSVAERAYSATTISERHRHRYEVNNAFVSDLEKAGLIFSGKSPDGKLCEIAELPLAAHPFFLGTQFHPELKARPLAPHPLFSAFIKASIKNKNK